MKNLWLKASCVFLIAFLAVLATGCGGGAAQEPPPPQQRPSVTLSATPSQVAAGGTASLNWSSQNATAVTLDNGIGAVALSGQMNVTPAQNTTYTATATGPGGSASASTTVSILGQVTIEFSASAQAVAAGQSVTLTWQTTNAESVTIEPGVGTFGPSGSHTLTPNGSTTYTARANGPGGVNASASAKVDVYSQPPSVTVSADKTTINAGELATLTWTGQNAAEMGVEPEIEIEGAEVFPVSGTVTVAPSQTTTYTFTAKNPVGTAAQPITINVTQQPPTLTFTADKTSLLAGESATLSWSSERAESITIDQGVGSVAVPSGTHTVSPSATTTYTATATGPGGSVTQSVIIEVAPTGELGVSISVEPATISSGQSATLTWDSQNASSVSITNCAACSGLAGSATVSPTSTTTYTATATGAGGATRSASATLTVVAPGGFKEKIKHIIFYMQENRSFDQYFGKLGEYREKKGLPREIDGFDPNIVLTDFYGHQVSPFHHQTVCHDVTSPGWNETHFFAHRSQGQWKMDFWLMQKTDSQAPNTNGRDPHYTRSMGYYTEKELPYYYELATQFATSDRFFASMMGPTIPNRMYLFTGTSFGHIRPDEDLKAQFPDKRWPQKTFFEHMTEHGVFWRYYYQDGSVYLADFNVWTRGTDPNSTDTIAKTTVGRVRHIDEFYRILADPNADNLLPPVVFIEQAPQAMLNEHPSNKYGFQPGVANTKKILDALMRSSAWKSSVFILTYDEAGGLYDHVPPVDMPKPDDIEPIFKDTDLKQAPDGTQYDFSRSGLRVPLIVVSPWAKKHFVSHLPRDFGSILKLIETRFDLPPLSRRDANADDMLEFFDFNSPSWLTPPPLPEQPWKNQAMVNDKVVEGPADPAAGVCDRTRQVAPGHPGP